MKQAVLSRPKIEINCLNLAKIKMAILHWFNLTKRYLYDYMINVLIPSSSMYLLSSKYGKEILVTLYVPS